MIRGICALAVLAAAAFVAAPAPAFAQPAGSTPTDIEVPVVVVEPSDTQGPNADEALFEALRTKIDHDRVEVQELDLDINDSKFALEMASRLHDLCQRR